ncbi:ScbA/BarX family gamma-butyrolactone biosynthesis protein [Streptomyces sp. NPDC101132]|uniref:ScbA/BarX family gamma-butyrolactone biosynthesis protein n=1 Tax=Streptomyces sp. NPDC101132 TaxID=3366110 RepID=UPI00380235DB
MTLLTFQKDAPSIPHPVSSASWTRCNESPQLTTTVPREYVHRSSLAEVFLTGYERIGDNVFALTGQWPRAHTFFTSADGRSHDPVQAGETIRQVGLFLCHAVYGVPLGHNVLLWSLDFTSDLAQLRIGASPTELELVATCTDFRWQGNRFSGFLHVSIRRNGCMAASGTARFTCVPPSTYRRLRGERGPGAVVTPLERQTPIPPAAVGRLLPFDVVLAPSDRPGRWLLNPDLGHPILFEHANDHHPGMVLVEAARQAACGLLPEGGFRPFGIATEFHSYAELDEPCWVEASEAEAEPHPLLRSVEVTGRQSGRKVFTATVTGSVWDS